METLVDLVIMIWRMGKFETCLGYLNGDHKVDPPTKDPEVCACDAKTVVGQ